MQFPATTAQGLCRPLFGACTFPPFKFQARHESMNWRRISALDVDRLTRELDVATLQENITDITFCNLARETCSHCGRPVDPALLKVMRLAQLIIEYLLHCQDYLSTSAAQLEAQLQASLGQQERGQQELSRQAEELKGVREESRRRHKMINTLQQLLLQTGGQSFHTCHLCDKTFVNATFLSSHIQRRHQGVAEGEKRKKQEQPMEEVLEELRAKLNSTQEELETLMEKQRQLQEAEITHQRERDAKKVFDEWKEKLSEEIDKQKKLFWDELKSIAYHNSPLEEKRKVLPSYSVVRPSLGSLRDEECGEQLRQVQEELQALREKTEIQDREWKRKINKLQKEFEATEMQLREENEGLQTEMEKLQTKNEKLQTEMEKLQMKNEKLQTEMERLRTPLSQGQGAAPQSRRQSSSRCTRPREQARLLAAQEEMVQALSPRKVEEMGASRDEQQGALAAPRQSPASLKQIRHALEDTLQDRLESMGVKKDAKGISTKTLRRLLKVQQVRREGKLSEFPNLREKLAKKATGREEEGQRNEALVSQPDNRGSVKSQQSLLVTKEVQSKARTLHESLPSKLEEPTMPIPQTYSSHGPGLAQVPTPTASPRVRGPFRTPASPGPELSMAPFSSEQDSKRDSGQCASPQPPQVPSRVGPQPKDDWDWSDTETLEGSSQALDHGSETPEQVIGKYSRKQLEDPEKKPAEEVNVLRPYARPQQAAVRERKLQLSDDESDLEDLFLQAVPQDLGQRKKSQPPEKYGVSDWIPGQRKVCDW